MNRVRKLNRRSFLASVVGGGMAAGALAVVSDEAVALQGGCSDSDPISSGGDPGGQGRHCQNRPNTGCSDRDPSDPAGAGRNCTAANQGCRDSDPSDPIGGGQRCGATNNGPYQTARHERRYEVCWVDDPRRSDDECNIMTYSEWQTLWSNGGVRYDTAERDAQVASMQGRGYSARWHRMLVNDWVGQ
ncbi:MAG TPA: hypothetical protein VEW04_10540 [Allosphingosinicella sp.]|nr:hypothetical protein [Allosphingosinicella sp.]